MTLIAPGARLTLWGLSRKGEQRLKEFNTVWQVLQIEGEVLFSDRRGPWLLIEPLMEDQSKRMRGARWIHGRDDPDFVVERVS